MASYSVTVTETTRFGSTVPVGPLRKVLREGLTVHATTARQFRAGALVRERVGVRGSLTASTRYRRTLANILTMSGQLTVIRAQTVVQGLSIHDLRKVQRALLIIQGLVLNGMPVPRGRYHLALVQSVRMQGALARFLGGTVAEHMGIHAVVGRAYRGAAHLAETIDVHPGFPSGTLLFRFDLSEQIMVEETDILRAIYRGTIAEGVSFWVAYIDPGGGFTTWAINTRTGAVTEYQNYVFNSMARLGHKFIGADDTGLWELVGNLDGVDAIPTRVKSGWMSITGSKFTSFKAAYLGLRVNDDGYDFFLKLHSGDGREYVYAVQPKDMATTKVHMGKGLRSRYFSFEIVTTGVDYDLDTIEFVPLASMRRV